MGVYITTETHRHDFNDELGDGKLFDGWDQVENKWEQYAHQVFGVEEESGDDTEDEGAIPRKPAKGKRRPRCRDARVSRCAYTDQCSPELVCATQHSHPHPTRMRPLRCAAWYTR